MCCIGLFVLPKPVLLSDIEESIFPIFPFLASELHEFLTVVSCVLAEFEGGVLIFECNQKGLLTAILTVKQLNEMQFPMK